MAQSKASRFFSQIGVGVLNTYSRLPMGVHYFLSDWLVYPLVYHVAGYRKKVVRKNIERVFPERTADERRAIERRFYHWFSDLAVEIVKVHSMSAEEIDRRVEWIGLDQIEASFAEGHDFALCYLSHYGNWEWLINLPLKSEAIGECQIYHPMRNKVFNRWFLANRSKFGAVNIKMKETLRKLIALRKEVATGAVHVDEDGYNTKQIPVRGYMFGCIADQLPKEQNVHHSVSFCGQPTKVFTGSEQLGRKLNMAMFYSRITRPERGRYRVEFERLDNVIDPDSSEFAFTDEYMRRFEQDVKLHPELWLWTHDRWKR
ncbi:MAG: lysophospholipid acyltransferase family protein [Bacteroidales bacterium]|nr:lysophospholipid acyltransferase family protein [Candidatus Liminaster caballi]